METRTLELETPDGPMPVYEADPGGARAAIVVIQEAFGINDHIEDVANRLAGEGYHAVAPALFHRTGSPILPYTDFSQVIPHMGALSDDMVLTDVDATLSYLRDAGWSDASIGIIGFCFGGRATFLVSTRRALGAAVGFYGGGIVTARFPQFPALIGDVPTLATPWLGFFGDDDGSIPVDDVETLRRTLDESAPVAHDVLRYAGAGHGFFCNFRESYHRPSAEDAWPRALQWFAAHLAARA